MDKFAKLFEEIQEALYVAFTQSELRTSTIIISMMITVLISVYIFFIYRIANRTGFYSKNFNKTVALMGVITGAIVLSMQTSVFISLGMVGALSIVRFRTAIKEPLDLVFLFWSIAAGIVLAAGLIPLAVFGSVLIGVMLLVFVNRKFHNNPYIVIINCEDHLAESLASDFVKEMTNRMVVKSKTAQENRVELTLDVRLKDDNTDFVNELAAMPGVSNAVLVSYNGQYMG